MGPNLTFVGDNGLKECGLYLWTRGEKPPHWPHLIKAVRTLTFKDSLGQGNPVTGSLLVGTL